MVERAGSFIEQWKMIAEGDEVIAGVSGGADSVCLCLVLNELSARMGFGIRVVHVEHGIRGAQSAGDAAFVAALCERLHLPCAVHAVDVPAYAADQKKGLEEAARALRYAAFRKEAEALSKAVQTKRIRIALAHHMEDNAETMLLQLVRGTGLDGLCGMQPVRRLDGFVYVRPLLLVSRSEIEAFLASRGEAFCQDDTNYDMAYSRNRIRHRVLPELEAVNARAIAHMNQTAARLCELRDYVDMETQRAYADIVERRLPDTDLCAAADERRSELLLHQDRFWAFPQVIRQRVIHFAIAEAAGARKDISSVHIQAVERLFAVQCGKSIDLPYRLTASRIYEGVCLAPKPKRDPLPPEEEQASVGQKTITVSAQMIASCAGETGGMLLPCGENGAQLLLRIYPNEGNKAEISTKMYTKSFDYDKIKNGFSVRRREKGDYFVMDEAGHHKKLDRYFIDQKIPLETRDRILLLARGAEVFWVIGGRMGRSGMVTPDTRTILEITYEGGMDSGQSQKA